MLNVARETTSTLFPPEPDLTPETLIARAIALRPLLRARQAECEANGNVPADVNQQLIDAGFYRTVQPRAFGGYEFTPATFYRVMMEISRGCSETAWVLALTAGHPLVAAFFSEQAQREAYGTTGQFRAPTAFNPPGTAVPVEGGYRVTGRWVSASGIDHATHFMTLAQVQSGTSEKPSAVLVMMRKDEIDIIDDWHVMGMQGTGSKSAAVTDHFVPLHRTAPTKGLGQITQIVLPGPRIHANPMYYGRIGPFMAGECAAVAVGAARGALDLYEEVLRSKKQTHNPTLEMSRDPEFLHHYGKALTKVVTAESALLRAGDDFLTYAREDTAGIAPFDLERELRLSLIPLACIDMAWEAIDIIYRTAGTSSSVKQGQPIGRYLRNVATIRTHPLLQMDRMAMRAAKNTFGVT
ncbi:MAG TPA: acyl-CoA dehydrogenase family protein [Xanthobacteraceae bacterium]|nr:acyl-CoA dehydrogenase family protein [Xanthobacteraceae bacterium]